MKLGLEKIVIIVLAITLIFSLISRPSKPIDMYEDEINNLKENNKNLILSNDSLKSENIKLTEEIKNILITIDSTQLVLDGNQRKINELENAKNNIGNVVRKLNVDGVTRELSGYLNKRTK
tara:strand:+ start:1354 stop:1716 length:363 start_codon:yes stop_codon:yes gene_type:complete